jgi:hypothetical protein
MQPVAINHAISHAAVPAAVPDSAVWAPAGVDAPADAALHTATLHAAARPQAALASEAPRPLDASLPVADVANGFALPADQLMPVTLIGLQVQAGDAWPMAAQAGELRWPRRDEDEARRPMPEPAADDEPSTDLGSEPAEGPIADAVVEDAPSDWLDPLTRALDERLAAPLPPAALSAAAGQWMRARCVLLVCPQAAEPGPGRAPRDTESAWAFVLWPRRGARPRGPMASRFAFTGQRIEARLQWPPQGGQRAWCSVRAVKEHHPRGGRRLVALDGAGTPTGPVPCELQLGPVRGATPRWCLAAVRVDAVRRLWAALGGQWSVLLVVCPQPLLAPVAWAPTLEA